MGLRPPRVVVVFDGGQQWTYWARQALHLCGLLWGGRGFAVVPHRGGKVDPVLLRACRAYDPDFVVMFPRTVAELERLEPGWFQIRGQDGEWLTGQERERMLAMVADQEELDPFDEAARDLVAGVCSPYRMRYGDDSDTEDVTILRGVEDRHLHDALRVPGAEQGPVLACRPEWGGLLGAAVASHAGIVERPAPDASEPELPEEPARQLRSWLSGAPYVSPPFEAVWFPTVAMGVDTKQTPTAHERTMTGLVTVSDGMEYGRTGIAVLGDTAEDFALARLWQLTFGSGVWFPSALGAEDDQPPSAVVSGLAEILRGLARRRGTLAITSLSHPAEHLQQVRDRLTAPVVALASGGGRRNYAENLQAMPSDRLPWRQPLTTHLALTEQFDTYLPIPTVVEETGTRSMAAPLPAPLLTRPDFAAYPDLTWHIDISWRPTTTVQGRGLDGTELFTSDTDQFLTWARSGRGGTSYQSHRYNFVKAGIPRINTLARPGLKDLSLTDWVAAKCREHHVSTRLSDAGQRTALLTRMLGNRQTFVDLFAGPLLPALRALLPASTSNRTSYPDNGGVVLSAGEGVLSFDGFCARTVDLTREQMRDRLDTALRSGVLRRGLVVQCPTCEQKQFQTINKLGQTWTCTRCDATADLDRAVWKMPNDEPTWHYDLHPVGRHLLRDHGEVPAMLSAFLSAEQDKTTPYHDLEEILFIRDGVPKAEADLIAYTNDTLIVAECKSADQLSGNGRKSHEEIQKKCQIAAWIKADQLIFATAKSAWTDRTQRQIQGAVSTYEWGPLGPPQLRLISDLGVTSPRW